MSISIPSEGLLEFSTALLEAAGVPFEEATIVAKSLVEANLRGHDSHGVMRIAQYIQLLEKKEILPEAPFTIQTEGASRLVADGHWGFGQVQAKRLTDHLIEKTNTQGLAVGTLIRSAHIGRLGEYCEMAAEAGLVSILMVNTHGNARRVAPVGGIRPRLGTNPIAMGVPNQDRPLILDIGTSATAEGKVRVKQLAGQSCPPGWLIDSNGAPSTDPNDLYGDPPGCILPMGGTQAYKGFGLALMVEIFAGALSGGVCIREVPINQNGNCVFMMVLNPAFFGGKDHFQTEVAQLDAFIRECPRAEDCEKITLPGDPERDSFEKRSVEGIPFDEGNWAALTKLAQTLQVPVPSV
ncbi:Malate dehydrogenase [Planctomycetales bacterium 10988]|nr:Malate dehydrogenase [Planctomycetales bacterium 10988]